MLVRAPTNLKVPSSCTAQPASRTAGQMRHTEVSEWVGSARWKRLGILREAVHSVPTTIEEVILVQVLSSNTCYYGEDYRL